MDNQKSADIKQTLSGEVGKLREVLYEILDRVREPQPVDIANATVPQSAHKLQQVLVEVQNCQDIAQQIREGLSLLK